MSSERSTLLHEIALMMTPGIGPVLAKNLISYCGSAESVFKTSKAKLEKIPDVGPVAANAVRNSDSIEAAEAELQFIEAKKIQALSYHSAEYPRRLLACTDGPPLLFFKGTEVLNHNRVVAIVGTRKPTEYGKKTTTQLVEKLAQYGSLIISGLAYGIDIKAHRAALECGLPTVGVMAHGFDRLYPSAHKSTAGKMLENGGLMTDFFSTSDFLPQNFIRRNRIVAGMADVTIVVESGISGGSMITADCANSYNRDVYAVPGKIDSKLSEGCNFLIKTNQAALLDSVDELAESLGWTDSAVKPRKQRELFIQLSPEESRIVEVLKSKDSTPFEELVSKSEISQSVVASSLLNLEFQGVVKRLPGKAYGMA